MNKGNKVIVAVPVYRNLTANEYSAVCNTREKFSRYDIAFVVPDNLDTTNLSANFPEIAIIPVSSKWIGPGLGVGGYNRMMMTAEFYEKFSEYEYILICHTDAWIFEDKLSEWCDKGYDIVAAPWLDRPKFFSRLWWSVYKPFSYIYKLGCMISSKFQYTYNGRSEVGNGGFSLRKTAPVIKACRQYAVKAEEYLSTGLNEDEFWARIPGFSYPSWQEALTFSIDHHPNLCYHMNGCRLPMACHGYNQRKKRIKFWKAFITID